MTLKMDPDELLWFTCDACHIYISVTISDTVPNSRVFFQCHVYYFGHTYTGAQDRHDFIIFFLPKHRGILNVNIAFQFFFCLVHGLASFF